MADLTSVGVTSGIPSSGTGTVATINYLTQVGAPISNGSTSAPVTAAITGSASAVTSSMSALVVNLSPNSSVRTVTLSSNPTVIPSSAFQVTLTSNTVVLSSAATVTPSSNFTVIPSSVLTVAPSSNFTVILSSNPSITSVSSGVIAIGNGANVANVLAGSSTVTSTMASLVVSISSNGAGIINTGTQTIPSSMYLSAIVAGDIAAGAADSGNPVKVGGLYTSSNPTAVTSGQRVNAWFDKVGRQIHIAALRTLKGVTLTSVSSTTTETNITPASSGGLFLDLYGLVLANTGPNAQIVTIKDSSGGTARTIFEVPATETRGFMLPVDAAIPQAASSQAWTATLSNSSGGFQVTALYVSNA